MATSEWLLLVTMKGKNDSNLVLCPALVYGRVFLDAWVDELVLKNVKTPVLSLEFALLQ